MTLGLTDSFPPSVDSQGLKQKEAVQSGSVSWSSRLVVGRYCNYQYLFGICLVYVDWAEIRPYIVLWLELLVLDTSLVQSSSCVRSSFLLVVSLMRVTSLHWFCLFYKLIRWIHTLLNSDCDWQPFPCGGGQCTACRGSSRWSSHLVWLRESQKCTGTTSFSSTSLLRSTDYILRRLSIDVVVIVVCRSLVFNFVEVRAWD